MGNGYFEIQRLDSTGAEVGTPTTCKSDTGVILNADQRCEPGMVRHLCLVARLTPNYPVDIVLWNANETHIVWCVRLYWRDAHESRKNIR